MFSKQSKLALILVVAVAACGDSTQGTDGDGGPRPDANQTGRYLPMAEGWSWTYDITDTGSGQMETKTSTVGALEDVGGMKAGTMAFKVTTEKLDGSTVSWQEDTGDQIIRHKEQSFDTTGAMTREEWYDPAKLRLSELAADLTEGAEYTDTYMELVTGDPVPVQKSETWKVISLSEQVTVPAGQFETLHVRRTSGTGATAVIKDYWFARGVGKIKETGGQTEELVDYTMPASP